MDGMSVVLGLCDDLFDIKVILLEAGKRWCVLFVSCKFMSAEFSKATLFLMYLPDDGSRRLRLLCKGVGE
jgi:hypothetical protein